MKRRVRQFRQGVTLLISATTLCLLLACAPKVSKEYIVTEEVSKSGKNWSETQTVQEYRGHGKTVKDKQIVYERLKCIGKNGKNVPVETVDECLERGGRVVNEVKTKEEVTQRR